MRFTCILIVLLVGCAMGEASGAPSINNLANTLVSFIGDSLKSSPLCIEESCPELRDIPCALGLKQNRPFDYMYMVLQAVPTCLKKPQGVCGVRQNRLNVRGLYFYVNEVLGGGPLVTCIADPSDSFVYNIDQFQYLYNYFKNTTSDRGGSKVWYWAEWAPITYKGRFNCYNGDPISENVVSHDRRLLEIGAEVYPEFNFGQFNVNPCCNSIYGFTLQTDFKLKVYNTMAIDNNACIDDYAYIYSEFNSWNIKIIPDSLTADVANKVNAALATSLNSSLLGVMVGDRFNSMVANTFAVKIRSCTNELTTVC